MAADIREQSQRQRIAGTRISDGGGRYLEELSACVYLADGDTVEHMGSPRYWVKVTGNRWYRRLPFQALLIQTIGRAA